MEPSQNIIQLFLSAAEAHPDKTAIIEKGRLITFKELKQDVFQTSSYFRSKGLSKGDRVLVFVPMSIELYRIVLALFNIGATAVFLDEWVNRKRMEECCRIADCKGFIGTFKARALAIFSTELRKIPVKMGINYKRTATHLQSHTEVVKQNDTALITFTTGSTGTPKAAKRTHQFLSAQFKALTETIHPSPDDIGMPALPIVLLINLGAGCTSVIPDFKATKPDKLKPEKVIHQLQINKVTRIEASPYFIKRIAEYCLDNNIRLLHLKKVFAGGAPVFPSEAESYNKAFSSAEIKIVYGSTEAEPVSSIEVKELLSKQETQNGLCVGTPYRLADVKIIKLSDQPIYCPNEEAFKQQLLPPMKIGEIIVSGPHVLTEYFNNDETLKRNKIFVNGTCYHRTGDSGYLNDDGVLFLTGRENTLIHSEGKIISPFIYENILQQIEGVESGTVICSEDNIIHLIIEKKSNASEDTIRTKIPSTALQYQKLSFVKKIPRDLRHNSKIDYERLRKNLEQG
ncbi:AMP-dependent synthetase [Sporocytophaga myxococcoides]|uniref:AMP-dependent synthetase n=1 Tax=Sporocytophaga myxococcoides TaxID=153721 RepID=A0A098LMP3_9BACT|nr:AMP-binding protein [Sporocytophaga myxococcoides]GAL87368.1 AMP-dependent synthetase [Sporocytophaga myxococcoides]